MYHFAQRDECSNFAENHNVKFVKLEELGTTLKSQKYPKIVAQKGIWKALAKLIDDSLKFALISLNVIFQLSMF